MTPALRAVLSAAILVAAAGCTSPMQMSLNEPARTPAPARKKTAADTRVAVVFTPLTDQRPEFQRDTAGNVGGRDVKAQNLAAWVDQSLQQLNGQRFQPGHAGDPGAWQVSPRLRQLYASHLRVSKNANVVIELLITPPHGGAPITRVYRGRITSVNWWNSTGEIESSVTDALGNCLKGMAADLDAILREHAS